MVVTAKGRLLFKTCSISARDTGGVQFQTACMTSSSVSGKRRMIVIPPFPQTTASHIFYTCRISMSLAYAKKRVLVARLSASGFSSVLTLALT